MIPLADQLFFMWVAAYFSVCSCAADHVAPVLARSVWSGAVAELWLMVTTLALDVATSTAELTEAVGARVHVWLEFISYSCRNYTFVPLSLCHLLPPHNEDHQ